MKKEYHKLLILSIIGISAMNMNVNLKESNKHLGNIYISQENHTSDIIVDDIISDSIYIDSSLPMEDSTSIMQARYISLKRHILRT